MKASLQTTLGFLLCASALAGGCGKKAVTSPPGVVPVTGATDPVASVADAATATTTDAVGGDAAKVDDKAAADKAAADKAAADKLAAEKAKAEAAAKVPLTAEAFEALVTAVADCKLVGMAVDPECPASMALSRALARKDALKDLGESNKALGLKLLSHASPALRVKAIELLGSRYGGGAAGIEALLAAYPKEQVKGVRLAFIRGFGMFASLEPKVAKALIAAMDDSDVEVRAQSIYALTQPLNKQLAGGVERIIKAAKEDPDPKLRRVACEHGGKLGDEKLLPTILELTKPKVDPELQEACMRGLTSMWADTTRFENASERAYHLTLRLLERTPRTKEMPSWVAISRIGKLDVLATPEANLAPGDAREMASWKKRSESWYKPADLRRVLRAVLVDPAAGEMAAAHAVTALAALGTARGELEGIKKELGGTPRMKDGGHVASAFERALAGPGMKKDAAARPKPGFMRDAPTTKANPDIKRPPVKVELAPGQPNIKLEVTPPPKQPAPTPAPKQP